MKAKLLQERNPKTFLLVFETGDEFMEGLSDFARENNLVGSSIVGIGGFSDVVVGYYDPAQKDYKPIPIREQVELLSLVGNVSRKDGEPKVHAHVTLGKSDGTAHGGHLLSAHVRPTLELVVTESSVRLDRVLDEATHLPLIQL